MFVKEEIEGKREKVRNILSECGLDGILIKKISNFAWLTGGGINYVGITTEVGICPLLITKDKDYIISNKIEAPRLRDEELLLEQGYVQKEYPWYNDAGEAETVKAILGTGKIGSDYGFPGSMDVNPQLNLLRWSLTHWEVERYRELGRATSLAIEETCQTIRPGDKECAVTGRLAERLWAERMDYITIFCAADDRIAKYRHPVITDRKIQKRAMLCVNSRKNGLIISLTRFVQFGKVADDIRKKYDLNVRIDCILMANSIPGKPLNEPFKAAAAAYQESGYGDELELHHQGGPIGYVGRETRVHWNSNDLICENQGFAWNPSITGSKSEDVMLATSKGPELLSYPVVYPKLELTIEGHKFARPDILEM
ncbi:MAG: aminopeptidase P family N-terminal domain-containing protein [Planctomycetes bacterium]|nr:aminopeptidase P family N-terminal domain-containing protein [Planctomycetota bacterium]